MNIGDKIKSFRNLKEITQKQLAELTGISETSIKKYETGKRNPKTEQIKKIASALETDENLFYDIDLLNLPLVTTGDVMAVLFQLFETVDLTPHYMKKSNGQIDPYTISLKFSNVEINSAILNWLEDYERYSHKIDLLNQQLRKNEITEDEYDELFQTARTMLELSKRSLVENDTLLDKEE